MIDPKQPQPDPSPERRAIARTEWLCNEGAAGDVVLSSRVRLARNLAGVPFVNRASRDDRERVVQTARDWILRSGAADRLVWIDLHESTQTDRTLLVERHLISKQLAKGAPEASPSAGAAAGSGSGSGSGSGTGSGGGGGSGGAGEPRAVAFSVPDERLSIMVNEEDHLRVQVLRAGLTLSACWEAASLVDDRLEAGLDYAFSPRLGYLTACPTNVGTGTRMSVMLHLPALKITGDIEKVKRAANDMNLAVRGFYGEGSDALGDLYQISNQTTLGKPEGAILADLQDSIVPEVVEYERLARRTLLARRRFGLEDQVWRAFATLSHARLMSADEAMQLISLVRLGVVLGVLDRPAVADVNLLFLLVQPAHLQRALGREMDQEGRKIARAEVLRARLSA